MSGSKPTPCGLLLFLILCFPSTNCSTHKNVIIPCPEIEKQALLSFKQSLMRDSYNVLSSWNTSHDANCCNWDRVHCSNSTGRVDGLDLVGPGLQGQISPSMINLTSLTTLDLSYNELTGKIPRGITNLCKLQILDLRGNMLEGEISDSFGNMSDCFLGALTSLYLDNNLLSGHLTHQFGEFKSLQTLSLWANEISGEIPANIGKLSSLESLSLQNNKLTGNIPTSIGQLSNLEYLSVGDNMLAGNLPMSMGQLSNLEDVYIRENFLEGVVTELHFLNCSKLKVFSASGNHLTLKVSPSWIPPFNVRIIGLGSWNLGVGLAIPAWLHTQKNTLEELDLSSTGISGDVPAWFWEIKFLDLSHNHLYGKIPDMGSSESGAQKLFLNSNRFNGSLPRVGYAMEEINLSNTSFSRGMSHFICDTITNKTCVLRILDLGRNHLRGEIPDCWMKWTYLQSLNLGNNNFTGTIPNSLGFLTDLLSLSMNDNKLSGKIPVSISNCTELVKMDLSSNYLLGNIPSWIGASLSDLRYLILRSNKLSGVIPSSICHLNCLQILDFSDNVISGIIPTCVGNFTAMATKENLTSKSITVAVINIFLVSDFTYFDYFGTFSESSSVVTKGNKYEYGSILSLVKNIDLSNNNLSGEIPKELTSLVELGSLNLSRNHLTGSTPKSIGDMKRLESLDLSRNSMFGEIPDSIAAISSLSYLNLSYNHLIGKIPVSTQLLGMNALSFLENNLCGPPLPTNCSESDDAHQPLHMEDNEGEIDWFYVFLSLGYAVGLSVVCTALVWRKS